MTNHLHLASLEPSPVKSIWGVGVGMGMGEGVVGRTTYVVKLAESILAEYIESSSKGLNLPESWLW